MTGSETQTPPPSLWPRLIRSLGPKQIGWANYFFLFVCVAAQLATFLITWPVWKVRPVSFDATAGVMPNLPWIAGTPQFSTAVLLITSLVFVLLSPRKLGMLFHLLLLGIAISMDQLRCQPQVLCVAFLMAACVWPWARRLCVWYLIAMWTWAGIHKFLSPDWFSYVSGYLMESVESRLETVGKSAGLEPELDLSKCYWMFAGMVALSEVATGILAWWRPKLGAIACVLLHLGIACFLLFLKWNYSVLPWNFATAIVGGWLIWNGVGQRGENREIENGRALRMSLRLPTNYWEKAIVVAMLLIPIGFYFGLVRHGLAHVLYSNNMPLCVINRSDRVEVIDSWEDLGVPFPYAEKPYHDYFKLTGQPDETIHIRNVLTWLKQDQFFRHEGDQSIREISEREFLADQTQRFHVCVVDDPKKMFQLELAGAQMKRRSAFDLVFAIQFNPENFEPEQLKLLSGIRNLEQIQLGGCQVTDEDLKLIPMLGKLCGIGLRGTAVTDQGLKHLAKHQNLNVIEHEGSGISDAAHRAFIGIQTGQRIAE